MNQVILIGRLVRDPKTNEARTVASFTVAVDRMKKDDGADFINCKAFGKTAENVLKYCHKGKPVAILGRINTGSYEDRDGKTVIFKNNRPKYVLLDLDDGAYLDLDDSERIAIVARRIMKRHKAAFLELAK